MRTPDEINKEPERTQLHFNAKSSFIRMLEGNTEKKYLDELRAELKPIQQKLQALKQELKQSTAQ